MISLNNRLTTVSRFLKQGTIADIGSDHAYLPIYAIQNHLCECGIAGEVIQGPFQAAVNNVAANQLEDRIDVRLGDGLSVIHPEDVIDNITICGMGGPLIAKILKDGQDKLSQHPRLILQSNIQTENLRQTLQQLNYEIIDEIIMEEKGHIYEIVVAEYSTQLIELSSDELKFGSKLLNNKNEYFIKKWQRELEALYHIKSKLNTEQHHQRLAQINDEIAVIERVL
ncbi:TPA: tRNA (adenine-N(1))-methyltransferase [Staphylococcus aureus]|nr:tRNA (adenine-N(1))-methyltransferase [Staphylococcus aureus]HDA1731190.1 tRNA (adenine-N(1))-methyltransferase [Staphylococcus aureus]HDA2186662.1 tRNA (adenine-N(1))-methyltransferase [Staphylococcus aureus]HDA2577973.1 tRNA (adenine-N(1))-methyltransferase [Staphylococcus aureus]HDA2731365.1 tRNA (adenine-N(1))-methyltransferase [Staphylococcus aureus]